MTENAVFQKVGCPIETNPGSISKCARSADAVYMTRTDKEEWHIKKTHNLLHRMTVWVVTAAMLLTSLPLLTVPVEAASISNEYTYTLKVKTANEKNAKTDNDVYCIVKDANGKEHSIKLDNKGDDFKKGAWGTYTFNLKLQPWEIHAVGFNHPKGADAVKIEKFEFYLPNGTMCEKTINTWFHKYKKTYSIAGTTDRQINSRGNFDSTFGQTLYYDPSTVSTSDLDLNWNGKVSDQYFSEYTMFDYPGAVGVTFFASGKTHNGGSSINLRVLEDNNLAEIHTNSAGYDYGITLKRSKLLEFMKTNQIYKFTLTATLDYLYDYDQYNDFSKTFTIYRKGFDLGAPVAITKAYTPFVDQNFYNSNPAYSTFEIKIPVKSFDNYDATTIAQSLASNIKNGTVPARVYYDTVENGGYVTPKNAYSLGSDVYLTCDTPSGFNNPSGTGITVQLDNAKATYSGQTYWLDHQKSASDTTRTDDYSEYISTHKVDTAGVKLSILNTDGSAADSAFDSYAKQHTFKLQSSESRIFLENGNGTRSEGYFSYQLLTGDGRTVKPLKNYKTAPTTKVPYTTNSVYTVEPTETLEGEYQLRITTRDIANNETTMTYPIKLDTIAPRVKYDLKQQTPIDGSRRNEYTFTLEDATGTGKLYYCIVPDGEALPTPGNDIPEHTGTVDSQYGRWSFINQNGASKTAVVSVEKGQIFNGTLYWYTVDAAGNDSRTEKIKGTNAQGYYYTDISINNIDAECKLVVEDSTPGKPYYKISFETNVNNRVEYLWRGANLVTKKIVYTSNSNPGSQWQTLSTGGSIQLNGEYTLEYTVTTPDGSSKSYTEKFLFDNTDPMIRISCSGDAVDASKTMTVEVSDITNITALTYQLHKADGTPVGDPTALNCGLPVVTANLMLEPEVPGMYYVAVTAADVNGQTQDVNSDVFGIRNGKPVQILEETVDFHIETYGSIMYKDSNGYSVWISTDYNGIPLTNQRILTFRWTVVEPIENLHLTDENNQTLLKENYALFYRFSADGINYSAWESTPSSWKYDHKLEAVIEVENPIVLREGENRIWVQAAFALPNTDPATIRPEMIATSNDCVVLLDTKAPEYSVELDSIEMTAGNVYGIITAKDNYATPEEITTVFLGDIVIDTTRLPAETEDTDNTSENLDPTTSTESAAEGDSDSSAESGTDVTGAAAVPTEKVIPIIISNNGDHVVHLSDLAGNTAYVDIPVACIDRNPPDIYVESANPIAAGERQDYQINFWIDKADDSKTEFALIRPLKELSDSDYGVISPNGTPNPEHPGWEYTVNLQSKDIVWGALPDDAALEGKHGTILDYNSMKVSPIVTDIEYPNGESRTNYQVQIYADEYNGGENESKEEPYILAVRTRDMLGNQTIQSIGNYMLLTNATAHVKSAASVSEYAYEIAGVNLKMTVPVYVMPYDKVPAVMLGHADGRLDNSADETVVSFAESVIDSAVNYTTEPVVVIGKDEIVNGTRPIYFADEAGRVYKQTLTVLDPMTTPRPDSSTNPCTVYLKFIDTIPVEVELYKGSYFDPDYALWYEPTLVEKITADQLAAFDVTETNSYYVVLKVKDANAEITSVQLSNSGIGQDDFSLVSDLSSNTTKVYVLNDTLNPTKSISYNVTITETVEGEEGTESTGTETTIGSVYQLTLRDTTPPDVIVQYSTKGFTNQPVSATIIASDAEFMTNTDGEDDDLDGTEESDGTDGIAEIAVSEFMRSEPRDITAVDYDTDTIYSNVSEIKQNFTENGYYCVRVTNEVGLVTYTLLEVSNINTDPITDEDYQITYYDPNDYVIETDDDGKEYRVYTVVDPEKYYKEVIAEIDYWSTEKGIKVLNNGGKLTKRLTADEREFTFSLRDKYGNEKDVDVSFQNFDTTAPTITPVVVPTNKTNEEYTIPLYVSDEQSGIQSVKAVRYTIDGADDVEVTKDTYVMTIPASGNYAVTVTDNSGNTAETSFTVTNIDTTKPKIADKKYTVTGKTRSDVGVKLYYNEPNVTMTSVTLLNGMKANDVSINYSESILRFYENGAVDVTFKDEYGNETTETVAVTNIFREVPVLTYVVTPAEDALSADVTFVPNPIYVGNLSEYYVIYHGITPVDEDGNILRADKVRFTFIDNGTYTFTVQDDLGNTTVLEVKVDEIDRTAPVITGVKWSYSYIDENGNEQKVEQSVTPGTEAGYNVVEDENNKATNQDITATITTDTNTKFVGSDAEYNTEHSVVYDSDGWYNFDVVKPNGLMDSYGLGLYLIDKEAPVIEGAEDLMFFENPRANAPFDVSLLAVTAYDERYGKKTDLTDQIKFSYTYNGQVYEVESLDALRVIGDLPYDKSKPVTVTYTVRDSVGNETSVRRTVTLVGLFDTTIRVNGGYTDANGMIEVDGGDVVLTLDNFAGMAWARYESGLYTMGQMKNKGTVINPQTDGSFKLENLSEGWYTFYIQTDLRDYFCVKVYIFE